MIKYYTPQDMTLWSGRIDDENDFSAFRWHQWVQRIDLNDESLKPFDGKLGFGILGFESDQGIELNKGRYGASAGPFAIRKELSKLPCQFNQNTKIFDCGNVTSKYTSLVEAQNALADAVKKILSLNLFPILLGGGHEIAFGHYKGLSNYLMDKEKKNLGIVSFDAHFDLRPYDKDKGGTSGTMFRQIADLCEERGDKYNYFVMGIQKHSNTQSLFDTADNLGAHYILAKDIINSDIHKIEQKLEDYIKDLDEIYITICSDVLSTAYAPGVSAPQPLGLDPEKILILLKKVLQSGKVLSFDIAEVSPRFDHDSITANMASILIYAVVTSLANHIFD